MPITLSLICVEVAERAGIEAYGIAFPGHFLVGLPHAGADGTWDVVVIDPFRGGKFCSERFLRGQLLRVYGHEIPIFARHLAPAPPQAVLERLLNNLRNLATRRRDARLQVEVLSRLLLLRGHDAQLFLARAQARRILLDHAGALGDAQIARARGAKDAATNLIALLERESHVVH